MRREVFAAESTSIVTTCQAWKWQKEEAVGHCDSHELSCGDLRCKADLRSRSQGSQYSPEEALRWQAVTAFPSTCPEQLSLDGGVSILL